MSYPFLPPIYWNLPKFMPYKTVKLNLDKKLYTIFKNQINMKTKYRKSNLFSNLDLDTQHPLENKASIFLYMVWSNLSCLQFNIPIYFKVCIWKSFNFQMLYNQLYLQKMTTWPSIINL